MDEVKNTDAIEETKVTSEDVSSETEKNTEVTKANESDEEKSSYVRLLEAKVNDLQAKLNTQFTLTHQAPPTPQTQAEQYLCAPDSYVNLILSQHGTDFKQLMEGAK